MDAPSLAIIEYPTLGTDEADEARVVLEQGLVGVAIHEINGPEGRSVGRLGRELLDLGLEVGVCWPEVPCILPTPILSGPDSPSERLELIVESLHRFAAAGAKGMACFTGPAGSYSAEAAFDIAADALRHLAREAAALGMFIAIEPMHESLQPTLSFLTGVEETRRMIDVIDDPAATVCFDFWHFADSQDPARDVRELIGIVSVVHLCDWRQPTRGWCDRVLMGEGVAPVVQFLRAFQQLEFKGLWEIEILSDNGRFGTSYPDSLWDVPSHLLLPRAQTAFQRCWEAALD